LYELEFTGVKNLLNLPAFCLFLNPTNSSSDKISEINAISLINGMAMPAARAVRSYACRPCAHWPVSTSIPIAKKWNISFFVIDIIKKRPVTDVTWFRKQRAGP
jgi:hypothetical protein